MALQRINIMKPPPDDSIYGLIEILAGCGTFIVATWKWIDSYFKSKKEINQAFVENIVNITLASGLKEFKSEFNEFRVNTEKQMTKFNDTVNNIYRDMSKGK